MAWLQGILSSTLASLFYALSTTLFSYVVTDSNAFSVGFARAFSKLVVVLPIIILKGTPYFGSEADRKPLILCVIFDTAFEIFYFVSLSLIAVSDTEAICLSYPVIVSLTAHFFNGTRFQKRFLLTGVMTIVGGIIISEPEFIFGYFGNKNTQNSTRYFGYVLALAAGCSMAGLSIATENIKMTSSWTVSFLPCFLPVPLFGLGALVKDKLREYSECGWQGVFVIFSGVLSQIGQVFHAISYKYSEARVLSILEILEMPLILILDVFVLGTEMSLLTLSGIAIIVISIIMTILLKGETLRQIWTICFGGTVRSVSVNGEQSELNEITCNRA